MIYTHVAAALLGAAVAATGAWQVQAWRLGGQIDSIRAEHAAALERAETEARDTERTFNIRLQEAQDAATKRETKLRTDAAAARRAADGLRGTLSTIRAELPGYSQPAAVAAADTAAELLDRCAIRYRDVAEAADRHAADALMLRDAWPITPRRPDAGTPENQP